MKKITSAYANKWLKSLEEDKEYWINKEEASSTYVDAINEEPVIPEYAVPEYRYVNYDLDLVKQEYERVSQNVMELQMALDQYNQTVQFEVDL